VGKVTSRKLKVFQSQIGFYDTVVAASSRAAALRAWGVHQDLFASGAAHVVTDPKIIEAAIAHPEIPLRRAVGSTEAFSLKPAGLPKVPDRPKKPEAEAKPAVRQQPAADRSKLDKVEAELQNLEERRKAEEAEFRRQQKELERRQEAAQDAYVKEKKRAHALIQTERGAYRKAGGKD
jgi:flagellar motility protein MotE (MotC chaperone)